MTKAIGRKLTAIALAAALASVLIPAGAAAQSVEARLATLEDQAALKRLVDTFSNLADTKEIEAQALLFTPDATVTSFVDGKPSAPLKGRKALADAFGGFLAQFSTVYHINGQQTVDIKGNQAKGTAYCLVVLIREEGGKTIRRTSGVRYQDRYVKKDGRWLIAERSSHFEWTAIDETPSSAS